MKDLAKKVATRLASFTSQLPDVQGGVSWDVDGVQVLIISNFFEEMPLAQRERGIRKLMALDSAENLLVSVLALTLDEYKNLQLYEM